MYKDKRFEIEIFAKKKALLFLAVFVTFFCYSMYINITNFYFDSSVYWDLGQDILDGWKIDFSCYCSTLRGYFYPFILSILKRTGYLIGNEYIPFRVFISSLVALIFSIILPYLFNVDVDSNRKIIIIYISSLVFLLYFGKTIFYPLSDLPAFSFFIFALYFLIKKIDTSPKYLSVSGFFFYLSYNTRLVYLYSSIIVVLLIFIYKKISIKMFFKFFCYILFGFVLASIPQIIVNKNNLGTMSIFVYGDYNGNNVGISQLYWGLTRPRYETYIGDVSVYPYAGMDFYDYKAIKILEEEKIALENFDLKRYISLILNHPLFYFIFLIKHGISIITPVFSSAYIDNIYQISYVKLISHIIMDVYFINSNLVKIFIKSISLKRLYIYVCIILPGMLQLFGAIELRFGMPILIPLYFLLAKNIINKQILPTKHYQKYLIVGAIFSVAWYLIIKNIINANEIGLKILQ